MACDVKREHNNSVPTNETKASTIQGSFNLCTLKMMPCITSKGQMARDKWTILNVSFVQRFYCMLTLFLWKLHGQYPVMLLTHTGLQS